MISTQKAIISFPKTKKKMSQHQIFYFSFLQDLPQKSSLVGCAANSNSFILKKIKKPRIRSTTLYIFCWLFLSIIQWFSLWKCVKVCLLFYIVLHLFLLNIVMRYTNCLEKILQSHNLVDKNSMPNSHMVASLDKVRYNWLPIS